MADDAAAAPTDAETSETERARADLAATLRWSARLGLNEGIANHYSYALADGGGRFLLNPYGRHWSLMRASDLLLLDMDREPTGLSDLVDRTAWAIHGALHRNAPHARCVMHLHPRFATALSALADPTLPPIDQNAMRYFDRVAFDDGFSGMGLGDEAERLSTRLLGKKVLLMGNHGVLTAAATVAEAFDLIYYFERAAQTYMTALATGRALRPVSDAVAETTARQWEEQADFDPAKHLAAIRAVLDVEEPDYRH